MSLEERSREYREFIEAYLKSLYTEAKSREPQKLLFEAMEYSLLAGGKRLRPIFAMDFCRMCGGDWHSAAPFAAAIEMIHTYSLIHDDLPCMDNDDFRRGRPTNHKVYGEGMAVLAGDALLTDAFMVASRAKLPRPEDMATAIALMGEGAGSLGMAGGQVLDILSESRELTEEEVLDIQSRKLFRLESWLAFLLEDIVIILGDNSRPYLVQNINEYGIFLPLDFIQFNHLESTKL